MQNKLSVSVLGALLVISPVLVAQPDLPAWDANDDDRISLAEWDTGIEMANVFDNLDRNNNEVFDVEEAELPYFSFNTNMDVDRGGRVERAEFIFGIFDRLDKDQDGHLDTAEFREFSEYAVDSALFD